jgi:hypothetical protein
MNEKKIFKPRPSTGWIWVGLLGLIPLAIGIAVMVTQGLSGPFLIMILITISIGTMFLLVAIFFPTMRYELEGSRLTLRYGPVLRYSIELRQIKSIRSRDLQISPVSSFRFPGLAIFTVLYPEVGLVKMCATAASRGILLIETASAKYGLTPDDEQGFVAELRERMRQ